MTAPFIGPMPYAPVPEQPTFYGQRVDWTAFDVPRIWEIVAAEDDPQGWEQVDGFRGLAELLVDHHRRLRVQHFNLTQAWQSPAALGVLNHLERFAESLLSDANCAQSTAYALHGIMETYAEAHNKVERIHSQWNNVTTDWVPEWWDEAAKDLNAEAQAIMVKTDEAIRDHRRRILAPELYDLSVDQHSRAIGIGSGGDVTSGEAVPVPPVPGYEPWLDRAPHGPMLTSSPNHISLVPAIPGQPVSMLPVPPGNLYAPHGGIYVLPGPGVTRNGFLVPMPQSRDRFNPSYRNSPSTGRGSPIVGPGGVVGSVGNPSWRSTASNVLSGREMGILPLSPIASPSVIQSRNGNSLYRRAANTVWPTNVGGPAVIDNSQNEDSCPGRTNADQEEAFKQWFAELAYPWRFQSRGADEPHIILRKISG
ncbi:hypothetical protein [Allorhizocola rhizosphaerae]|uniref:hypothetical protein n=1 Tax=Allorhizocola rhizosphaerae TaxID=1872709 RepID=UPI0013C32EB5|nr:hypothetical protein [Allorhizocola rhizosphaerae]